MTLVTLVSSYMFPVTRVLYLTRKLNLYPRHLLVFRSVTHLRKYVVESHLHSVRGTFPLPSFSRVHLRDVPSSHLNLNPPY